MNNTNSWNPQKFESHKINKFTVQHLILNSNKHKHTATTLLGLVFLAVPLWDNEVCNRKLLYTYPLEIIIIHD